MEFQKKVIGHLSKCYAVAPFTREGETGFLVAAEKQDACFLFDRFGHKRETVWQGPGGVMSMVQLPGREDAFLATNLFYSPNDSAQARIVMAVRTGEGVWKTQPICALPFVHRFDILSANGAHYLIACTLKSGHREKDDWSSPGKVYAALLPEDFSGYSEDNPLALNVLKDNLTKNHGYFRVTQDGRESSLICCEEGVFRFTPPDRADAKWSIQQILATPTSDAALIDLDGDGLPELVTISPFHGDSISIYHRSRSGADSFEKVYSYPARAEFAHAIWAGQIGSVSAVVIGHRGGTRDLLLFTYDTALASYRYQLIDHDCGAANVLLLRDSDRQFLVAANRERDEIAMYELSPSETPAAPVRPKKGEQ